MKFAGYYYSEDAQFCERCGSPIANVFQVEDEYGEIHEYGSTCVNIVLGNAIAERIERDAESRKPRLPIRKSHNRTASKRNLNIEYLDAVTNGNTKLAESLKARIIAKNRNSS